MAMSSLNYPHTGDDHYHSIFGPPILCLENAQIHKMLIRLSGSCSYAQYTCHCIFPREETCAGSKHLPSAWTYVCVCVLVTQSFPTLCNPMDCSPPGFSFHGILQARILESVVMPSPRGSPRLTDWTQVSYVSCIGRWVPYNWRHLGSLYLSVCVCVCVCVCACVCACIYIHIPDSLCCTESNTTLQSN